MTHQAIQLALHDACSESNEDVTFTNSYSGRGMYGSVCVGITGTRSDCNEVIAKVIKSLAQDITLGVNPNAAAEFDEAVDTLLTEGEVDCMGRGTVLYWRNLNPIEHEMYETL